MSYIFVNSNLVSTTGIAMIKKQYNNIGAKWMEYVILNLLHKLFRVCTLA